MSPVRKSDKDDAQYVRVKEEDGYDACLPSPTLPMNRTLPRNNIKLEKWIIKPLGDGVCVEGHRRSHYFNTLWIHWTQTNVAILYICLRLEQI